MKKREKNERKWKKEIKISQNAMKEKRRDDIIK
jgi:hypothetical protein